MGNLSFKEKYRIPIYDDPNQINNGSVNVDPDKCTGCGFCVKACPADALVIENKLSKMPEKHINECMGCGDCTAICPEDAIVLTKGYEYTGFYKTIDRGKFELPRL